MSAVPTQAMPLPPPFPPEQCRGEACVFGEGFDAETEEPTGRRCGRVATQVIFWRDMRFSPSCGKHGLIALTEDARARVLCVHPIEPAFVVEVTP